MEKNSLFKIIDSEWTITTWEWDIGINVSSAFSSQKSKLNVKNYQEWNSEKNTKIPFWHCASWVCAQIHQCSVQNWSLSQKEDLLKTWNTSETVSKDDRKHGATSPQDTSKEPKTSSDRKSNRDRNGTVVGRRENSCSPSLPKHFLNEGIEDKFKTSKGRLNFTQLRTELGSSVKFLDDRRAHDQKETAWSQKEKSTKGYKIQRLQKTTKFQEMGLGEVSLCACSKLHLFPNVYFWLLSETLAGLDGSVFRQIMSIFLRSLFDRGNTFLLNFLKYNF